MVENRSAPPGAVVPNLVYEDVPRAIEWLRDAFGFRERLRWGPPDAFSAQLDAGGGSVVVRGPRVGHGAAVDLAFRAPRPGELSQMLTVATTGVDAHARRASRFGAEILIPLETYPFGERQYSVRDLAGYVWCFTESVSDVAPVDWGARSP